MGGPLLFSIMMRLLQIHSETAVQYLVNSAKNLQIKNFEGENVSKVVSHIRSTRKRLKQITSLPVEFPQWVLKVLQTSSVQAFNKGFSHLQRKIEVVEMLSSGTTTPAYMLQHVTGSTAVVTGYGEHKQVVRFDNNKNSPCL
jgi:3-polyprenyl-4-hydroxybenzoate decarboxylase